MATDLLITNDSTGVAYVAMTACVFIMGMKSHHGMIGGEGSCAADNKTFGQ